MSTKALRKLDDLLFGPEAPARLLAVQGLLLILIALRTILSPYPNLAGAPAGLFKPAWILGFLDRMPSRTVIVVVQLAVVIALDPDHLGPAAGGEIPQVADQPPGVGADVAQMQIVEDVAQQDQPSEAPVQQEVEDVLRAAGGDAQMQIGNDEGVGRRERCHGDGLCGVMP